MSRRATFVVVAIEDVRLPSVPFVRSPVRIASGSAGVPGGGDGVRPDTTGQAVSGRLSDHGVHCGRRTRPRGHLDGDQACGRSGIEHGRRWSRRTGPGAGSGWGWRSEHVHYRPVRSGPGWAGSVVVRGRLAGAWSDAGRWKCPPLGRRCPDWVRTHWLGGHLELGMSGRPDGREVRHVRRPASHCRVSAGETGRRRRCPGGCPAAAPGRKRATSRTAGMSDTPRAEVLEVATRRSRVGCTGRRAALARRLAFRHRSGDGRVWRRGGSVGIGKWLPSVGARWLIPIRSEGVEG